jgi:flagellar protein FliS
MSTKKYSAVQSATASKERLMVMLFDTALKHMRTSIRHLERKELRPALPLLEKASQIVAQLHATLKREEAPKLVDDLLEIYTFTLARLSRSMVTGNPADVREAERAFAPIADGFSQAVAKATAQQSAAPAP